MKIGIILGTRPEIIKCSPIIRILQKMDIPFFVIHTGQHYSFEMDTIFFKELGLLTPKYNLGIGRIINSETESKKKDLRLSENPDDCAHHGKQTGLMLAKIEEVIIREKPDIVLVEGDTNTVLAGALAATKLHIKIGHIEAGLRSNDNFMPEEINRILTDRIADYLFCPTKMQEEILVGEGIKKEKIFVTGNTIVDAVSQNLELSLSKKDILQNLNLEKNNFFLATVHREENVNNTNRLYTLLNGLSRVYNFFGLPIVCPMHLRTKKRIEELKLIIPPGIRILPPLGYLSFLQLMKNAKLILTDSGGIQEEACILQVPCLTLRKNTERPETLHVGANILVGDDLNRIVDAVSLSLSKPKNWPNPFGDGTAAEQIVRILKNGFN